jgi:hypothetical protein
MQTDPSRYGDPRFQTVYAGVFMFLILSGVLLTLWLIRRLIGSLRESRSQSQRTKPRFD